MDDAMTDDPRPSPEARPETTAPQAPADGSEQPAYSRRVWIIDWRLQGTYALHLLFVSLLSGLLVAFGVAYFLLYATGPEAVQAGTWERQALWGAIQVSAIVFIAVIIASVFLSHRIAGPAYRLRRSTEAVTRGERGFRIHLRRHDQFKAVADAFNHMIETIEAGERAEQSRRVATADRIRESLKRLESGDADEFPEALRLLEEAEEEIRRPAAS